MTADQDLISDALSEATCQLLSGDRVLHSKRGEGTIAQIFDDGNATVKFPGKSRPLLAPVVELTRVSADGVLDALDARAAFAAAVDREAHVLRVRDAARNKVGLEKLGHVPGFDAGTLAEVLARPADPAHRVEGLIPWASSTLVVAQRKTGKTTLMLNLARCLLSGEDFLQTFPVQPVTGTVAILNFEVTGAMLAGWAREVGVPEDRLLLVNLRGRRNPLRVPEDRQQLATLLRAHQVEALIVDPFGRAYAGKS